MQEPHRELVTLVLGGVRSGKSRFALQMAARWPHVHFVATAQARDEEMRRKIERHQLERPAHWSTTEAPLDVAGAIRAHRVERAIVVVDCLTLWAANLMEAHGANAEAIETAFAEFCEAIARATCPVVLVSNEVGSGIVPEYESGRKFRDLLGELNQRVAAIADNVVLLVAGLPLAIKGSTGGLQ